MGRKYIIEEVEEGIGITGVLGLAVLVMFVVSILSKL